MAKVKLGESVKNAKSNTLWRYISLDKFVDLLATESLFFAPLSFYEKSDPFEGYPPIVSIEAQLKIWKNVGVDPIKNDIQTLKKHFLEKGLGAEKVKSEFFELEQKIISFPAKILQMYKEVAKSAMLVNCWHSNEHESEAMWKIYSDSGKGIAIKTTIQSLQSSLEECVEDVEVNIGAIKYLDYFDPKLSPRDCVVDQHAISPLIKRKSYEHEHELRLWISRNVIEIPDDEKMKPRKIRVNPGKLIEKVIISPLATEPFISSVKEICQKYCIGDKVEKSDLLDVEKLFLLAGWNS